MTTRWDHLLLDATLATFAGEAPYGLIENGAIALHQGRIAWVGPQRALAGDAEALAVRVDYLDGALVTPGLIDCHTHLVFGGNRAHEFDLRLNGASYEEIARAGGGIVSTVKATREASEDALFAQALPRAHALLADGVTTIEIKSGYGLDLDTERRMLRVARRLGKALDITVRTTFLGLHALPPEFRDDRDTYVDLVCDVMLPTLARRRAGRRGRRVLRKHRLHARGNASRVRTRARNWACRSSCTPSNCPISTGRRSSLPSTDFPPITWNISASTASARWPMHGTVAVLLPGAFYALRETKLPPIASLREHGVAMAVATDCNPGTSPLLSLRLAASMACTLFRLTPGRSLAWRHHECRQGARPFRSRHPGRGPAGRSRALERARAG